MGVGVGWRGQAIKKKLHYLIFKKCLVGVLTHDAAVREGLGCGEHDQIIGFLYLARQP